MKFISTLMLTISACFILAMVSAQTTYESDPPHTHALFRANHLGISYTFGRFNEVTATLNYDAENVENSDISFSALTESVSTGIDIPDSQNDGAQRDGHLRSPDFFNAAQFPTLDFASTSVSPTDDPNILSVTGDLTIHGVTNEVTLEVEKTGEGTNREGKALIGFYTEFMIDRTEYGMNNLLQAAGPEVLLMISFEGVEQ